MTIKCHRLEPCRLPCNLSVYRLLAPHRKYFSLGWWNSKLRKWPSHKRLADLVTAIILTRNLNLGRRQKFLCRLGSLNNCVTMANRSSTVVEHSPRHPMVEGLSPAIATDTRRDRMNDVFNRLIGPYWFGNCLLFGLLWDCFYREKAFTPKKYAWVPYSESQCNSNKNTF